MPRYKVITVETTKYEYNIMAENEDEMYKILDEYQSKGYGLDIDHECDVFEVYEDKEVQNG